MSRDRKEKICFMVPKVFPYFFPSDATPYGGAQKQAYLWGRALKKDSLADVCYVVHDYGQGRYVTQDGIEFFRLMGKGGGLFRAVREVLAALRSCNADLHVFRSANIETLPLMFYLKYVLRRKTAYMVANLDECSFWRLKGMRGLLVAACMEAVFHLVDVVCVQTNEQKELLAQKTDRTPYIVRNIINLDSDVGTVSSRDIVLWVGRADRIKRPEIFLDLAERFPEERFVMVCPEGKEPALASDLAERASRMGNVRFSLGETQDALAGLFSRAKAYVMTSESEGYSNSMMEAMLHANPVCSLEVDPDGILASYGAGCVAQSAAEFYENFRLLMGDEALRLKFGNNGRAFLERAHTPEIVVEDLKKAFGLV